MLCSPFLPWLIHNSVPLQIIAVEFRTAWVWKTSAGGYCNLPKSEVIGLLPTNRIEPNKIVHQNIYTTTEIKQEFNKLSSNNKGKASLYFFNPGEKQYNVEKHTSYKHYHTT